MPATKHMIDAEAFAAMKDGVRLVNFARGELVDNAAALEGQTFAILGEELVWFDTGDVDMDLETACTGSIANFSAARISSFVGSRSSQRLSL